MVLRSRFIRSISCNASCCFALVVRRFRCKGLQRASPHYFEDRNVGPTISVWNGSCNINLEFRANHPRWNSSTDCASDRIGPYADSTMPCGNGSVPQEPSTNVRREVPEISVGRVPRAKGRRTYSNTARSIGDLHRSLYRVNVTEREETGQRNDLKIDDNVQVADEYLNYPNEKKSRQTRPNAFTVSLTVGFGALITPK